MADPDYFTLAEFRALPDMDEDALYPDAAVLAEAAAVTAIIEREVSTSFVARTVTEVHDGGVYAVVLDTIYVRSITSASVGGVAISGADLRARHGILSQYATGTYTTPSYFSAGTGNVSVTYVAGYSTTPPADIKQAAMWATRARLFEHRSSATINARSTTLSNGDGTFSLATAGENRPTGYPEVDAVIMGWKSRLDVPSIA